MPKKFSRQKLPLSTFVVIGLLLGSLTVARILVETNQDFRSKANISSLLPTTRISIDGIYPHLAVFGNSEDANPTCCNETGIGATVYWANKLWMITYPPSAWKGSHDSLYAIDPLTMAMKKYGSYDPAYTTDPTRADFVSVGGTASNRMIHEASNQLIIGPYFINSIGKVRVIPTVNMLGRITGIGKHLTDPDHKVYIYTMEQGLYEVDVNTLNVKELHKDGNAQANALVTIPPHQIVPGAHGKSAYTGQGRLIVANNGEGGGLASWDGQGSAANPSSWTIIDNNKYTDITGPGGISGSKLASDPIWAIGWDARSPKLMLLDNGSWSVYRFPKAFYSFDQDHGWNTEWPRIHKISDSEHILDMFGTYYLFPSTFSVGNSAGIKALSNHLAITNNITPLSKNLLAISGNDTSLTIPLSSYYTYAEKPQSNIRFTTLDLMKSTGNGSVFGALWLNDAITAGMYTDPFYFGSFENRLFHIKFDTADSVRVTIEIDETGNNVWKPYKSIRITNKYGFITVPTEIKGQWIRFKTDKTISHATIFANYSSSPIPPNLDMFAAIPLQNSNSTTSNGILRPLNEKLQLVTINKTGETTATPDQYYEVSDDLKITAPTDQSQKQIVFNEFDVNKKINSIGSNFNYSIDNASIVLTERDKSGALIGTYRLPKGDSVSIQQIGNYRKVRQVVTDRLLMNVGGIFYELPFLNAGGAKRIRPISTHNRQIYDFATWRGMLVLSGTAITSPADTHYYKTEDGKTGLWFGSIEDLWQLGAPVGVGGPWLNSAIEANVASDPYLMAGFGSKKLTLSHSASTPVVFTLEVDILGTGFWQDYNIPIEVLPNQSITYTFPAGYETQWIRLKANTKTTASAIFTYTQVNPNVTPTSALTPPACTSFTTININSCPKYPNGGPSCTFNGMSPKVTINATKADFYQLREVDSAVLCNIVTDWSPAKTYKGPISFNWNFTSKGLKKLCLKLIDGATSSQCGASITLQ